MGVERDLPFYRNSGGGMTVSGGEPFFQKEFTLGLSKTAGLGKQAGFQDPAMPPREQAESWAEKLRGYTAVPVVLLY